MTTFVLLFLNRESDKTEEDGSSSSSGKRQLKLSSFGVTTSKRKSEEIGSSGKSRCKFFQSRKLEQLANF
jgi:ribonuclease H2 subunit A